MERGWMSTSDTIKRTQRDIKFMNKMFKKYGISSTKSRGNSSGLFSPKVNIFKVEKIEKTESEDKS